MGNSVRLGAVWQRRCAFLVLGSWLSFAVSTAFAMQLYPGGNWLDPSARGHRFFYNFFCDLSQPVSLSGFKNEFGSACARFGMWCFALALAGFFWLLPLHFAGGVRRRTGMWVRGLGIAAVVGVVLLPLLPSLRFGRWHGLLALCAGACGLVAALLAVIESLSARGGPRALGRLGALALLVGGLDAASFACHLNDSGPTPLFLPAAQKVAALLLSAWMVGVAWFVLRSDRAQ